jgi:hypothetical protein
MAVQHGISAPPLAKAVIQPLWQQPACSAAVGVMTAWSRAAATQDAACPAAFPRRDSNQMLKNLLIVVNVLIG